MNPLIAAYFAAILVQIVIRARIDGARRAEKKVDQRITGRERASLSLLSINLLVAPILYAATPWLAFADYALPPWSGALGLALLVVSLVLFWRGHADLGVQWSPTLEIRERHQLITRGIYGVIRHPMYASLLLWGLAQPLLLHNWIAGGLGPITATIFYALRVGPEERMMLDAFGDEYRAYMRRVGGVVPRLGARST
ncbi:MAG: protein-S-isoprenylcysteine O-methyltransferase [Nannocystaceae bacterium]